MTFQRGNWKRRKRRKRTRAAHFSSGARLSEQQSQKRKKVEKINSASACLTLKLVHAFDSNHEIQRQQGKGISLLSELPMPFLSEFSGQAELACLRRNTEQPRYKQRQCHASSSQQPLTFQLLCSTLFTQAWLQHAGICALCSAGSVGEQPDACLAIQELPSLSASYKLRKVTQLLSLESSRAMLTGLGNRQLTDRSSRRLVLASEAPNLNILLFPHRIVPRLSCATTIVLLLRLYPLTTSSSPVASILGSNQTN